MSKISIRKFLRLSLVVVVASALFSASALAATGVPKILNHQGRLLDGDGNLLGGSGTDFCFKFSIYDDATVGAPDTKLWPTGAPSIMTINVKNGIFNVGIGDTGAGGDTLDFNFQDNDTIFLNVEVADKIGASCTDGDETFENLAPRQRIVSSGYTINAETVGGFTPAQSASANQIPVLTSGNLILGATNPQINVTGVNALTLQSGVTGDIQFFSSSNTITSAGNLTMAGTISGASLNLSGNITFSVAAAIETTTGNITLQPAGAGTSANVQIGAGGAGSETPDFLGLDVKSSTGDPVSGGFEGAMYYNTFDNKFRCYQGTGWTDCIGAGGSGVPKESHIIFFAEPSPLGF